MIIHLYSKKFFNVFFIFLLFLINQKVYSQECPPIIKTPSFLERFIANLPEFVRIFDKNSIEKIEGSDYHSQTGMQGILINEDGKIAEGMSVVFGLFGEEYPLILRVSDFKLEGTYQSFERSQYTGELFKYNAVEPIQKSYPEKLQFGNRSVENPVKLKDPTTTSIAGVENAMYYDLIRIRQLWVEYASNLSNMELERLYQIREKLKTSRGQNITNLNSLISEIRENLPRLWKDSVLENKKAILEELQVDLTDDAIFELIILRQILPELIVQASDRLFFDYTTRDIEVYVGTPLVNDIVSQTDSIRLSKQNGYTLLMKTLLESTTLVDSMNAKTPADVRLYRLGYDGRKKAVSGTQVNNPTLHNMLIRDRSTPVSNVPQLVTEIPQERLGTQLRKTLAPFNEQSSVQEGSTASTQTVNTSLTEEGRYTEYRFQDPHNKNTSSSIIISDRQLREQHQKWYEGENGNGGLKKAMESNELSREGMNQAETLNSVTDTSTPQKSILNIFYISQLLMEFAVKNLQGKSVEEQTQALSGSGIIDAFKRELGSEENLRIFYESQKKQQGKNWTPQFIEFQISNARNRSTNPIPIQELLPDLVNLAADYVLLKDPTKIELTVGENRYKVSQELVYQTINFFLARIRINEYSSTNSQTSHRYRYNQTTHTIERVYTPFVADSATRTIVADIIGKYAPFKKNSFSPYKVLSDLSILFDTIYHNHLEELKTFFGVKEETELEQFKIDIFKAIIQHVLDPTKPDICSQLGIRFTEGEMIELNIGIRKVRGVIADLHRNFDKFQESSSKSKEPIRNFENDSPSTNNPTSIFINSQAEVYNDTIAIVIDINPKKLRGKRLTNTSSHVPRGSNPNTEVITETNVMERLISNAWNDLAQHLRAHEDETRVLYRSLKDRSDPNNGAYDPSVKIILKELFKENEQYFVDNFPDLLEEVSITIITNSRGERILGSIGQLYPFITFMLKFTHIGQTNSTGKTSQIWSYKFGYNESKKKIIPKLENPYEVYYDLTAQEPKIKNSPYFGVKMDPYVAFLESIPTMGGKIKIVFHDLKGFLDASDGIDSKYKNSIICGGLYNIAVHGELAVTNNGKVNPEHAAISITNGTGVKIQKEKGVWEIKEKGSGIRILFFRMNDNPRTKTTTMYITSIITKNDGDINIQNKKINETLDLKKAKKGEDDNLPDSPEDE